MEKHSSTLCKMDPPLRFSKAARCNGVPWRNNGVRLQLSPYWILSMCFLKARFNNHYFSSHLLSSFHLGRSRAALPGRRGTDSLRQCRGLSLRSIKSWHQKTPPFAGKGSDGEHGNPARWRGDTTCFAPQGRCPRAGAASHPAFPLWVRAEEQRVANRQQFSSLG